MTLRPSSKHEVNRLIDLWHRHHEPVVGLRFAVAAEIDGRVIGAVVVGRPVAPALQDGRTDEVTRLVLRRPLWEAGVDPWLAEVYDHPNAGSKLLGACSRSSEAQGCWRIISYTRIDETGGVYRAAGWTPTALVEADDWERRAANRGQGFLPGLYTPTTEVIGRVRWERHLGGLPQPAAIEIPRAA